MRIVGTTAAVAALSLAGALAFAGPAAADDHGDRGDQHGDRVTTIHCGQTLTQSVRLTNDLVDCHGDGLLIGADDLTVDLNGHTIDGDVTQTTECEGRPSGTAGVRNDAGHDGLTIKDGTVQQFANGIAAGAEATGMADSRLRDLLARDNRFNGITIGSSERLNNDNRIEHNVAYGNGCGYGIGLNNAHANHVARNRTTHNGNGILICCSDHNVVEDNWCRPISTTGSSSAAERTAAT